MTPNNDTADTIPLLSFPIATEEDVVTTRQLARHVAQLLGFSSPEQTKLATAVSEITRNAYVYAGKGEAVYSLVIDDSSQYLQIEVSDQGPGIEDLDKVLSGSFKSATGLGIGISGSRNLVSDFLVRSAKGSGTYIRIRQDLETLDRRISSSQAQILREKLLKAAALDPMDELRQQNRELVRSLDTITKQREMIDHNTRELEASNRQRQTLIGILNSALASLTEAVCVYDRDLNVMYSNSQCDSIVSKFDSNSIADAFDLKEELKSVIETQEGYRPAGFDGVKRVSLDGEEHVFLPSIVPMSGEDESATGAVLSLVDVTEYELIDQLKSDLIGTLSHEVKTPTTTIRMAVQLLLEEQLGPLNDQQRGMLEAASTEVERLLRILRNLLDLRRFSKEGLHISTELVPPSEIVNVVIKDTHLLAQQSEVQIETKLEEQLPQLNVDLDRMTHALGNLVTNAIRYSPPDSVVTISAVRDSEDAVTFRVADQGDGIPHEYQSRIFERFVRVPNNRKPGTGLGLYIAREFVSAHKGRIGVKSEPRCGSEFYITLPIGKADTEADESEEE